MEELWERLTRGRPWWMTALMAFCAEDYSGAVALLYPIRHDLSLFGGSHAQRDVFHLTLTDAAIRAKLPQMAGALSRERLDAKPESPTNRLLADRAREAVA